jgi:pyocin large subunit-like protein
MGGGWGRPETLAAHFADHGADFGAATPQEYAQMSQQFPEQAFRNPNAEMRFDPNGNVRIYDPRTNTFGAYNPDGSTRTFFKPSSDSYWARNTERFGAAMSSDERRGFVNRVLRGSGRYGGGDN